MTIPDANILLIGAGKMGEALLEAWGKPSRFSIVFMEADETRASALEKSDHTRIRSLSEARDLDCVVLAVKPQSMEGVLCALSSFRRKPESRANTLILSIAAGKTLAYFKKHMGDAPIVRAMPNLPATIGEGITALCANDEVSEEQRALATLLMDAAGEVVWIEDESQMDAVTAISGSGPAYVFLLKELLEGDGAGQEKQFMEALQQALEEAAHQYHLPEPRRFAVQTVNGSEQYAQVSPLSYEQLRRNVTSPGGTTEAALKVLMRSDALPALVSKTLTMPEPKLDSAAFNAIMKEAIAAAAKRSQELA